MEQTEKNRESRTCANCANGPEPSDDCETCEDRDKWSPIEIIAIDATSLAVLRYPARHRSSHPIAPGTVSPTGPA